jgi:molybdenum cofactor cytidylyltransferase
VRPVAGLVLAAGRSTRFGAPKTLAVLEGRPMLEHVLESARAAGLDPIVVVVGDDADAVETAIRWRGERRVRNPDPGRGLSSSLRLGLDELAAEDLAADGAAPEAVVVLLGDEPRTDPDVIRALVHRQATTDRPVIVSHYAAGGGANPVLITRAAFALASEAHGDRGLGPVIDVHPELVEIVDVAGSNADVDTREDLERLGRDGAGFGRDRAGLG